MSNLLNPPDSIDCPDDLIQRSPRNGYPSILASGHDPGLDRCRESLAREREARVRRQMAASLLRPWLTVREVSRTILARRGER